VTSDPTNHTATASAAADVVIVGAGLAGLSAALEVVERGQIPLVLEAADAPGGRVRTDQVDGFLLDRGFQILLTAYPEARRLLDYDALDLAPFAPGAVVQIDGHGHRVADPFRRPGDLWATARAPVGSLIDKARLLDLRRRVNQGGVEELFLRPDTTARAKLIELGFSSSMIERFFRPLFAGITLDPDLAGSSRQLEFVFRMLSTGAAAVPAAGMGAIPDQLAALLPAGSLRLGVNVTTVERDHVVTDEGEEIGARSVVLATDVTSAARLVGSPEIADPGWNGVTSVWFAADAAPTDSTAILLDGDGRGPAVDVAVMSNVNRRYAPAGRALIVASALSLDDEVPDAVRRQMRGWFGSTVDQWQVLRTDRIPNAQPRQVPGYDPTPPVVLASGVFVAGDHRHDPSINGALASGRRAGRAAVRTSTE
jgi:phytoene dehydrogenase-like protein